MRSYIKVMTGGAAATLVALAVGATAAAPAALAARSGSAAAATSINVVEAGATPGRFLFYVALYGGMLKKEGLSAKLVEAASGSQAAQLLAGGQVSYELGQLSDGLNTALAGQPIDMVADLYSRYANSLIIRKDKAGSIKTLADLGGIPIGITGVGSGTWQLVNLLGSLGKVPTSNLNMVSIGGAAIASGQSLSSGAVDAQVSNDPTDLQLVKSGQASFLYDPMNMNYGIGRSYPALKKLAGEAFVYNTIFTTQAYTEAHPAVTQKLVNALQLAADYVHNQPASKVAALLVKNPEEAPFGKALLTQTVSDAVTVAHSLPTTLPITALAYKNTRSYESQLDSKYLTVPFGVAVNNSYAEKALKKIGTTAYAKPTKKKKKK